ncbi:hypothetical protein DFH09DRAFT_1085563 [Mycena vulgaris]|nr:hypothetical protein DFH09DRAFT_1085563 [Mycena vulgaris]
MSAESMVGVHDTRVAAVRLLTGKSPHLWTVHRPWIFRSAFDKTLYHYKSMGPKNLEDRDSFGFMWMTMGAAWEGGLRNVQKRDIRVQPGRKRGGRGAVKGQGPVKKEYQERNLTTCDLHTGGRPQLRSLENVGFGFGGYENIREHQIPRDEPKRAALVAKEGAIGVKLAELGNLFKYRNGEGFFHSDCQLDGCPTVATTKDLTHLINTGGGLEMNA